MSLPLVVRALGCNNRLTFHRVFSLSSSRQWPYQAAAQTPNLALCGPRALHHGLLRAVSSSAVDSLSAYTQRSPADSRQPRYANSAATQLCAASTTTTDWWSTYDAADGLQPSIWHAAWVWCVTFPSCCDGNGSCFWLPSIFDARLVAARLTTTNIATSRPGQDRWTTKSTITSTEFDERAEHYGIADEPVIICTAHGNSNAVWSA